MIRAETLITGDVLLGLAMDETRRVVKEHMTGAILFLEGVLILNTPVGATKDLSGSWETEYKDEDMEARAFNIAEYAQAVEDGRKAAFVPLKPLELWVRRVMHIPRTKSWWVAKRISIRKSQQVTPGQFFARDTFQENLSTLNTEFINLIGLRLVEALGK